MVDDDILGFYIPVHDALRMTVVKSFEDLEKVVFAVVRSDVLEQWFIIGGLDMLKNKTIDIALSRMKNDLLD